MATSQGIVGTRELGKSFFQQTYIHFVAFNLREARVSVQFPAILTRYAWDEVVDNHQSPLLRWPMIQPNLVLAVIGQLLGLEKVISDITCTGSKYNGLNTVTPPELPRRSSSPFRLYSIHTILVL